MAESPNSFDMLLQERTPKPSRLNLFYPRIGFLGVDDHKSFESSIWRRLGEQNIDATVEAGFMFLVLHELAHFELGHLGGDSAPIHDKSHEFSADTLALQRFGQARRSTSDSKSADAASFLYLPALLLLAATCYVEDLRTLVDNVARAMPSVSGPTKLARPKGHPTTRERLRMAFEGKCLVDEADLPHNLAARYDAAPFESVSCKGAYTPVSPSTRGTGTCRAGGGRCRIQDY